MEQVVDLIHTSSKVVLYKTNDGLYEQYAIVKGDYDLINEERFRFYPNLRVWINIWKFKTYYLYLRIYTVYTL